MSKSCIDCAHCIPIGEGDHLCDETLELVMVEYEPSDEYLCCGGKQFVER